MTPFRFALAGVYLSLSITPVLAEEASNFNIPAQPLASAINSLSQQSGLHVFYADSAVQGRESTSVNGTYTPKQALSQLLSGSGVQALSTADDTVALKATAPAFIKTAAETSDSETTLPKVTVEADSDNPYEDPAWANSPHNTDYHRPNASTATKTDTPIMETPYSVKVLPSQVLKDQQVIRLEDAIQNVAGVQSSFTDGGDSDVFIMRGFQNTNKYLDGFLQPSALGGGTLKRETANLERIEVLKGPGSVLFGRNEPGGVINMVTKRPLATPYYALQQQFGSYDFYRTTADATGPITKDDILLYRVNLSYENSDSFRDFVKKDSVFFAPSLTWNISPQTQANLDIQYQHFDNANDSGVAPIGNRPAPVPINRQLGDPFNNKTRGDRTYVAANWSHAFNDNWKLSHRFGAEFLDVDSTFTFFFGQPDGKGNLVNVNSDFSVGNRGFNNGTTQQQNYYTTLNLTGKFNTAMLEHSMLWGFDFFEIDNQGTTACCAAFPEGAKFNIINPTYLTAAPNLTYTASPDMSQEWYGLYWQDQIKFPFNVYGNVGVRYDNATGRNDTLGITTTDDDRVSPRGGLLWRPLKWLSMYGNYSQNFGPSNSLFNAPGQQALAPQTAEEWELGAKTEFFNGRLTANFAYFDLTRKNMAVPHPIIQNLQVTIGEQESRGYEFEATGEILPGWNVIGAYTHLSYARINKDVGFGGPGDPGDTGHRLYNAARNFGSLWTTYEFLGGALQGLKFGGGVIATSQREGTTRNDFQLPGYATLNLMASYGMKVGKSKVSLQLNANNLLDKTYYTGNNTGSMIGVGQPRSFMGSVKVEF
ncbi:MAG: TonB-dependent receptor [Methyloglobulus sp.]|nr:TonB-dependent receptor [Methyloglobulus sp.]